MFPSTRDDSQPPTSKMCARQLILAVVLMLLPTGARLANGRGMGTDSGEEPGYWDELSIIVAQFEAVVDKKESDNVIRLRPLATLEGSFDCSRTKEIDCYVSISWRISAIREPPKIGAFVVAVIEEKFIDDSTVPGFSIPSSYLLYVPQSRSGLLSVDGLADGKIDKTREAVRAARKKSGESIERRRRPPVYDSADGYWKTHSLIAAEVKKLQKLETPQAVAVLTLTLKSRAVGFLDPHDTPQIDVEVPPKLFAAGAELPGKGSSINVLIARDGTRYTVAKERLKFMPGDHSPLCLALKKDGGYDFKPVPLAESAGYWATHSLVFAKIKTVADSKQPGKTEIAIEAQATIAGRHDPALKSEISVTADSKLFKSQSAPGAGTMALVLFDATEKGFVIPSEANDFMPGPAHHPICQVWDLADNRVAETLKAIQDFREKASRK